MIVDVIYREKIFNRTYYEIVYITDNYEEITLSYASIFTEPIKIKKIDIKALKIR